jgi:putative proteasome-type protease
MTYCVAIQVDQGLVFAADTRTSASFDDVRIHSKMHVFEYPGERVFVLMSAGNLGTTQSTVARLGRDAEDAAAATSLRTVRHMFEAADYVGQTLVACQAQAAANTQHSGVNLEATLVLGGQIRGEKPSLYLIYPQGNWIATSPETPYLQIGESKYGKPILDRIVRADTSIEDAARCALVSLDSTIRSNVSVGPPIDLALLLEGELKVSRKLRLDTDTPLYVEIRDTWSQRLESAVRTLPRFDWEPTPAAAADPSKPQQRPPPARPDQVATQAEQAAQQQ